MSYMKKYIPHMRLIPASKPGRPGPEAPGGPDRGSCCVYFAIVEFPNKQSNM